METDWKKCANSANLRSSMYGLLATIFREEPSEGFIKDLRDPRMEEVFMDMGVDFNEVFYNTQESEIVEALGIEFARLFIGPETHISAHESIFAEAYDGSSALWGEKTIEVKSFIETTGLHYKDEFNGIPDHVSVELEFMQKLADWEAERWRDEDNANAEYGRSVQQMFLQEHLLNWLPEFCDEVMEKSEKAYYRVMAELTKNYIEFERQAVHNASTFE